MSHLKESTPKGTLRSDEPLLASKSNKEEIQAEGALVKEEKSSGNKWSILFLVAVSLTRKVLILFFDLSY
jgi:hypothetical protein